MKTIVRALRQDLQRAFDALAMAHHGEMLCRSTKYRVLSGRQSREKSSSGNRPIPARVFKMKRAR